MNTVSWILSCWRSPIGSLACFQFWYWVMVISIVIGLALLLAIAWRIWDYRRKLAAALAAEERRQAVDHEAIAAMRWTGDDHYSAAPNVDVYDFALKDRICLGGGGGWDLASWNGKGSPVWRCRDCGADKPSECAYRRGAVHYHPV